MCADDEHASGYEIRVRFLHPKNSSVFSWNGWNVIEDEKLLVEGEIHFASSKTLNQRGQV